MAQRNDSGFAGLLSHDEAVKRCFIERLRQGTIVFTNGVFDLLHAGHVDYLEKARELGTVLVVGLNSDESVRRLKGPQRPLVSQVDRAEVLLGLRSVDHVVFFDEDTPQRLIEDLSPHILVKGSDYKVTEIAGADHVLMLGGQVVTMELKPGRSTSSLIETIRERFA
jgi:rfaE bifunctional protein nucleotidyltransferase chain/domain